MRKLIGGLNALRAKAKEVQPKFKASKVVPAGVTAHVGNVIEEGKRFIDALTGMDGCWAEFDKAQAKAK